MEDLLQELATILGTIGAIEALPYPESVQRWVIRDVTVTACLLSLTQLQAETNPRFNGSVMKRFLSDMPLKDRVAWLVKDAGEQKDEKTLLQCLVRHEETFRELGRLLSSILPSEDAHTD
jgi:hypothetical protein